MVAVIIIVILAVVVIGLVAWIFAQRRRSTHLRDRFGPEYDQTVRTLGDKRQAERELAARQERVEQLHIQPLNAADQARYADAWRATQARFVDDPSGAIADADRLIAEVMQKRGYPVGDFDARAADLSVEHPRVVSNYRAAHAIADANANGRANTEDLRQAMVSYRTLFQELLEAPQEVRS
jgi:hypothetical protein